MQLALQQSRSIQRMQDRLKGALRLLGVLELVYQDFVHTFTQLGFGIGRARELSQMIISSIQITSDLQEVERRVRDVLLCELIAGRRFGEVINEKLSARADVIYGQIAPYLRDADGRGLDYGCGEGRVAWQIWKTLGLYMSCCDVRDYLLPIYRDELEFRFVRPGQETFPGRQPFSFVVVANVIHHAERTDLVLAELSRLVRKDGLLIVIETVPYDDSEREFARTLLNDWLPNRVFQSADIPVAGTYETAKRWRERFEEVGFRPAELSGNLPNHVDLGYDQSAIRDLHVLDVYTRT